ncbi:50S ribosomal protein L6 [Candidatus Saccharibacteria bacterium]|nr:50S ribosomal protein L6 [Candidatus Saccharibacteria bacterium]NIV03719.1 50S ribosomal protein L6 [Calditrichia bacterium]NIV72020.1 50S ribosomal protein L6 [Calditrichia bacterium]NIV98853.1 50S ribosomal protein L6 [Candidatus Saccharibacteria bacterium]NIW79130.1 50S ribosomal protein L6 [Calditrichia bacterium]
MSRIGNWPIKIPENVEVNIKKGNVNVKGPKGSLEQNVNPEIKIKSSDNTLTFQRPSEERKWKALHGLTRTLVNNMILGVTQGFSKTLVIEGVGYRVEKKGSGILLALGYSHPVYFVPPEGITVAVEGNNRIIVSGIDKALVGQVAAKIRSFRPPEPYKGKGIRYETEQVRRKAGKTGK